MAQEKEKAAPASRRRFVLVVLIIILLAGGALVLFFNGGFNGLLAEGFAEGVIFGQEKESDNSGPAEMYELPEFVVNLADEGARRYLKTVIYLGYTDASMAEELEQRKPEIRDTLINILRQKKSTDLKEPGGVDDLRREILAELNDLLDGELEGVYFWDFIIQ